MIKNQPKNLWKDKRYSFPSDQDLVTLFNYCKKKRGYVYVIKAIGHEDWGFKIGRTKENPFKRARQFESEGVLIKYEVINAFYYVNASWAEREAHKKLEHHRLNKEWFNCNQSEIYDVLSFIYEEEQRKLSTNFDTSFLITDKTLDDFLTSGWYPESFIA